MHAAAFGSVSADLRLMSRTVSRGLEVLGRKATIPQPPIQPPSWPPTYRRLEDAFLRFEPDVVPATVSTAVAVFFTARFVALAAAFSTFSTARPLFTTALATVRPVALATLPVVVLAAAESPYSRAKGLGQRFLDFITADDPIA